VIFDGGIMRGVDVVKAIALGADAVAVGKAFLYGLAAGEEMGVSAVLDVLTDETRRAMGLLGVRDIRELRERGIDLVRRRRAS
jgi:L-lactate dehydrogenase (cytochrome)